MNDELRQAGSYQTDGGRGKCEEYGPLFFRIDGLLSWYEWEYVAAGRERPRNCLGQQKKWVSKQDLGRQWGAGTDRVCWEAENLSPRERREQDWTERQDGDESEMGDWLWSRGQVRGTRMGQEKTCRWREREGLN